MNTLNILLGVFISLGSICSYIPQFYNIFKYQSVKCISEQTLLLMNLGLMFLTMNSLIYNWSYLIAGDVINLLPLITIFISWIMVLIYYSIYITYKIKNLEKRFFSALSYLFTYVIFKGLTVSLAVVEKMENNKEFFNKYAQVLGYFSAVLNGLVYIPQIYVLIKEKNNGNVSILMYILQTPGNLIIIFFQAYLYRADVSTWITYLVTLVEQCIILTIMLYFKFKNRQNIQIEDYDVDSTI